MPASACAAADAAPPPGTAPSWAVRARGPRLWDAHGRAHLDYGCAAGAVLLGHADREVEAVAAAPPADAEAGAGDLLAAGLPGSPGARFTSDAASAERCALALAVRATGRAEVLRITGGLGFDGLAAALAAGDVAAVVLAADVLAAPNAQALRAMTAGAGVLLVLDETATGLRRGTGGLQAQLRVRADLSVWGAGLANGRALGAVTGDPALLAHAPFAPAASPEAVAACAAVLRKVEREDVALILAVRGAEVEAVLEQLVAEAGLAGAVRVTGDPTCIALEFGGPDGRTLRRRFAAQLAARGVHAPGPLCVGHRHDDGAIDALLDAASAALQVVAGGARAGCAQAA